jgi:DNA end-binding protein Ku
MATRPSWKGHLKFSLVSCPVELYSAVTEARMVSFHLINPATNNRIQMRPHDPETGDVDRKDLVRGYEIDKGRYVTIEEEDLKKVRLKSTKTLEIEVFVDADAVDPVYFDTPFYLVPDGAQAVETYAVIREALRKAKKMGIGRLVLAQREHVMALRPHGKGIMVSSLRNPLELRDEKDFFGDIPATQPKGQMVEIAATIIGQNSGVFKPAEFKDRYETALRDLIKMRTKGKKTVVVEEPEEESNVVDLMAALKQSLRHGSRQPPAEAPVVSFKPRATKTGRAPAKRKKRV